MYRPLKLLSLIAATLVLTLAFPLERVGTTPGRLSALAQTPTTQDRKAEADRLLEQGTEQMNAGQLEAALQSLQQALTTYQEIQDRQGEGQILKNLGNVYYFQKNYAKAIEYQEQALAIAQEIEDRDLEARALLNIGVAYKELGESAKAIDYSQQSLAIAQAISSDEVELKALNNFSIIYTFLENYTQAIEYQQKILAIARERKDRELEWSTLVTLVGACDALKDYQNVIEFAQQGLTLARETQNSEQKWAALSTLVSAYDSLESYEKVVEYAQQGLVVARDLENRWFEWRALAFLSGAYSALGNSQQAVEFAQQSLAIAQANNNRELEARALIILSVAYYSQRDYPKMIEFAQESLAIAQAINNRDLESKVLEILGTAYWEQRDHQKAIESHQQALAIYRELKDRDSELSALYNLIGSNFYLGDYQEVIELAQQQLALAREVKDYRHEGYALAHLGFAYVAQGDSQKVIEFGEQALVVGRENKSYDAEFFGLLALSIGYASLEDNEKALEFSRSSLALARDPNAREQMASNAEELALNITGSLYEKVGRKEQAITAYRESLAINEGDFNAQVGLARIYRELNMPVTAITYYKHAISNVEQIRGKIPGLDRQLQESFLQAILVSTDRTKNADVYRELADLLLTQGRVLEAQEVLELLKVQELNDFTRSTHSEDQPAEVTYNQTEQEIRDEHGSLIAFGQKLHRCEQGQEQCSEEQLRQLRTQRTGLFERFDQTMQRIEQDARDRRQEATTQGQQDFISGAEKIVEAQPGTLLIYPLVLEDKIWLLWASEGDVLKSVEVPGVGQARLWQTVSELRQLLQRPTSNVAKLKATSAQLYTWLIKPLEADLKAQGIQHLVFSLDGAIRYIPVGALFDGEKYLIETYTVSTVLSANLTDVSDRLPVETQNTPVLALGLSNAVSGFNALENVPAELDAIVRQDATDAVGIYPGLEFLNEAFDEAALSDNLLGRRVVHIATHGEFLPSDPDASYLLLGTGEKLPIRRIQYFQNLGDVHLVVLSACETALGVASQDGVEINGISSYFLTGKASAVIASLWKVNDGSTSQLMQQFYSNLAKGTTPTPVTKAEALRQAQLNLLRDDTVDFSHPYYWAPFILIGNGL